MDEKLRTFYQQLLISCSYAVGGFQTVDMSCSVKGAVELVARRTNESDNFTSEATPPLNPISSRYGTNFLDGNSERRCGRLSYGVMIL